MISAVYVEQAVAEHPRSRRLLEKLSKVPHIEIERYGEVFNRRDQNFRLQKKRPALILAAKPDGHLQDVPEGYGIGGEHNFYFSHLLNCPYDCRYCFLQGMYSSAHFVLFVDYEAFFEAARAQAAKLDGPSYFFSGYDADSLALEGLTGFAAEAIPAFEAIPNAILELRTKSASPGPLLEMEAHDRCVVAYSFTAPGLGDGPALGDRPGSGDGPAGKSEDLEKGVPAFERRLQALAKVAEHGWPIGLRFDPLIWHPNAEQLYADLFERIFAAVPADRVHSVSLGPFRLPAGFFKRLEKLHPDSRLVQAGPFENHGGMVSYRGDLERRLVESCSRLVLEHIDAERFFPCPLPDAGEAAL